MPSSTTTTAAAGNTTTAPPAPAPAAVGDTTTTPHSTTAAATNSTTSTGRANFSKHVEPFLKKYLRKSLDDKEMGHAALTAAFVDTRIYLNVFNSFYRGLSAAMDAVDESPPNWHDVGQLTNGSEEYADILIARCDKLLSAMKDEKWSCG
jgi:hypothetical protein